ncbi:MAG: AAA family ATPase [Magnetospirillum sp.]|nr:AAA family ATPase [Magnetospirillum sp.]
MSDDIPIADPLDSKIWTADPSRSWDIRQSRRIWNFVLASCPLIAAHLRERGPNDIEPDLFADLAVRASRAKLSDDVVGSLWFLAASRSHVAAAGALVGMLAQSSNTTSISIERRRAIRHWRRRLARVEVLDDAKQLTAEFSALVKSADLDERLAADRSRPESGRELMVLAPALAAEIEQDREIKPYKSLGEMMRLWRPKTSFDVLQKVLHLEFPHLGSAIDTVLGSVMSGGADREPPVLLVGAPGLGKDALWRRACELTGRPFVEYELAGTADSRALKGTARGWSSRNPSYPAQVARRLQAANPCVLMTELDKAGGNPANGLIVDTLLAWLEPGSRGHWFDEGLGVPLDLSRFTFGFSANRIDPLPGPLRNRLRIIAINAIAPTHVDLLLANVRRRHATQLGVREGDVPELDKRVVARLRQVARQGGLNLRLLERVMRAAFPERSQAIFAKFH